MPTAIAAFLIPCKVFIESQTQPTDGNYALELAPCLLPLSTEYLFLHSGIV